MFPFFFKNISYMDTFATQLALKKYYAIYKRPQSTSVVFCQFYTFLNVKPTPQDTSSNSNPVSHWVTWQTNRELYTRTGQTAFTIFCFQKMFKIT